MAQDKFIDTLENTIVTYSLLATKPINDGWTSLTGEDPMSWKSNLVVRAEILWFFLHMMDRYAYSIGGPEVRATLQDAIVEHAIQAVLIASFDTSHAKKGFDSKEWLMIKPSTQTITGSRTSGFSAIFTAWITL